MFHRLSNPLTTATVAAALAIGTILPKPVAAQTKETLSVSGSLAGSLTFTTDYRFRGVSQTFGDPALQGGAEFTMPSNFYLGTWASVVDKEFYANTRGLEWDLYAGYKRQLRDGVVVDIGLLQYLFPSESRYSTLEAYAGIGHEWLSFRYYHSLSNRFFGVAGARGSQYYDLTANYPLGNGLHAVGHYGIQRIHDNGGDYTDFRVGVTQEWKGLTWGASYFKTDSNFAFTNRAGRTRDLGEGGLVLSVSKTF